MVTKERPSNIEEGGLWLPWDHFLIKMIADSSTDADPEKRATLIDYAKRHIDSWRSNEWKPIVRELHKSFNWTIPDGLEPHWTAPGKAIYWQEQIVRKVGLVADDDGTKRRVMQEVSNGWKPVTSGLPAANASNIAHYLEKGFRLRPPEKGVSSETKQAAELPEVSLEPEPLKPAPYICRNHLEEKGDIGFATWKGYLRHCDNMNEEITLELPMEVRVRMQEFSYYCVRHDIPFKNWRSATRHRIIEMGKRVGKYHQSVDEMTVKKN